MRLWCVEVAFSREEDVRGKVKVHRNLIVFQLLLVTCAVASGQAPLAGPRSGALDGVVRGNDLSRFEEIALRNNPTLAGAMARVGMARGRMVQAGLYPNPVAGYHATEVGNLGTSGGQGGFVSQRFITGHKLTLDRAIAAKEFKESRFLYDAQQQRVLNDVHLRFYDALVSQRRVELTHDLVKVADDLVRASQKLLEGGLTSENDSLQAEIEAEQTRLLLENAKNKYVEMWRRLAMVVGLPSLPMDPLDGQLDGNIPQLEWEDCLAGVLDRNPDLSAARMRVERARLAIRRARKENVPDVDLSVSIRHMAPTDSDVANVQAGIPLPLFDRNQGNIMSACSELVATSNEVRRIELDLQDRLAVAFRRYVNSRQQVDRYTDRILGWSKRSLDLVTEGYRTGQVDYITLVNSQRTYIRVHLSYIDSLRELRQAATMIAGQLLIESLAPR